MPRILRAHGGTVGAATGLGHDGDLPVGRHPAEGAPLDLDEQDAAVLTAYLASTYVGPHERAPELLLPFEAADGDLVAQSLGETKMVAPSPNGLITTSRAVPVTLFFVVAPRIAIATASGPMSSRRRSIQLRWARTNRSMSSSGIRAGALIRSRASGWVSRR